MRILLSLIVGAVIGGAVIWFFSSDSAKSTLRATSQQIEKAAKPAVEAAQEQLKSFRLTPDDIKEELSRSGGVVRRKAAEAGKAIANATDDARITATIKAKLVADPNLSALSISVNTTAGVVTLSGSVSSPDDIGKAMLLAMDVEGVHEVASTLQVHVRQPGK